MSLYESGDCCKLTTLQNIPYPCGLRFGLKIITLKSPSPLLTLMTEAPLLPLQQALELRLTKLVTSSSPFPTHPQPQR